MQEHLGADEAAAGWELRSVPRPAANDAGSRAAVRLVRGTRDPNGGGPEVLCDGRVPTEQDQPAASFFFQAGSKGGCLLLDLQSVIAVAGVRTYSWHAGERAPQVYTLYAAAGTEPGFSTEIPEGGQPTAQGWTRIASVDTDPKDLDRMGGQYAVAIADSEAAADLGRFRYLLFEVRPTSAPGPFGQTFLGEIDVIDRNGAPLEFVGADRAAGGEHRRVVELDGGRTRIVLDSSGAPDLASWVETELVPMVREWYPEIARMLPSAGYEAPRQVTLGFTNEGEGVAATSGTRVTCWTKWFRANLQGEAKGAVLHELVHVVQQYGRGRNRAPGASRPPGWLVEGIPDYIRWFRYEPRSGGALIRPESVDRVRYDGSYRVSANFLNWVTQEYGPRVYRELNAAMREGRYREELWKELTGHTPPELGEAWKADLARQRPVPPRN